MHLALVVIEPPARRPGEVNLPETRIRRTPRIKVLLQREMDVARLRRIEDERQSEPEPERRKLHRLARLRVMDDRVSRKDTFKV